MIFKVKVQKKILFLKKNFFIGELGHGRYFKNTSSHYEQYESKFF